MCQKVKPLDGDNFYRRNDTSSGFRYACKTCSSKRSKQIRKITANQYKRYERSRFIKNPEKVRARALVRQYVYEGKIKRMPCMVCGQTKSEAHHEDYKKPLDVIWLCRIHHNKYEKNKNTI